MGNFLRSILVEDESGAQLMLYEYQDRRPVFNFMRKARRVELGTGERVECVDANTFVIVETGESLKRVK